MILRLHFVIVLWTWLNSFTDLIWSLGRTFPHPCRKALTLHTNMYTCMCFFIIKLEIFLLLLAFIGNAWIFVMTSVLSSLLLLLSSVVQLSLKSWGFLTKKQNMVHIQAVGESVDEMERQIQCHPEIMNIFRCEWKIRICIKVLFIHWSYYFLFGFVAFFRYNLMCLKGLVVIKGRKLASFRVNLLLPNKRPSL